MDTSPDLSLKIRRGSGDSRDNFYMDFAQGIDSDIEEIDNSVLQQTTTSSSIVDRVDNGSLPLTTSALIGVTVPAQVLPTLSEQDDLPSPSISPPTSITPPLSPQLLKVFHSIDPTSSPPIETEDEDEDIEKINYRVDNRKDEPLEQKTSNHVDDAALLLSIVNTPPDQFTSSYNIDEEQLPQPMQGSTPSISPSPPITPPPCLTLGSLPKETSPLPVDTYEVPPFILPPENNQSTSEIRTPLDEIETFRPMITSIPLEYDTLKYAERTDLHVSDEKVNNKISTSADLLSDALKTAQMEEVDYKGESTTINEVPSDEYSASFVLSESTVEGELEEQQDKNDLVLMNIDISSHVKDELSTEQLPIPEEVFQEVLDEEVIAKDDYGEGKNSVQGSPTSQISQISQITTTVSEYPKRKNSDISIINGAPISNRHILSCATSRRGSQETNRSSSIKLSSRAGSVAALSLVSISTSITPEQVENVISPSSSVKSSTKLSDSTLQKTLIQKASLQLNECLQSPQEGDSAPSMPSPPLMRSPEPKDSEIVQMNSPAKVTSPPQVYSPHLISSPQTFNARSSVKQSESSIIIDEFPITHTFVDVSDSPEISDKLSDKVSDKERKLQPVQECTVSSAQIFSLPRHQINSHHHYHLPHQFQHPHHQNHHTHIHGAVPVSTPTVPVTYISSNLSNESRNTCTAINNDDKILLKNSSPPIASTVFPSITNLVTSSEITLVDNVSLVKLSSTQMRESNLTHHVTIDESTLTGDGGSGEGNGSGPPSPDTSYQQQLTTHDRHTNHFNLMYHSSQLSNLPALPAIKRTHRPSFIYPPMPRIRAGDTLATLFSALYGKLLVVMGIAFPMAEVISTYIPPSFYEVYYLYLYIGSMIFLLFMYATLIWGRPKIPVNIVSPTRSSAKTRSTSVSESMDESDTESCSTHKKRLSTTITVARRPSMLSPLGRQHHYGSFYLRMGAVAFGIGSMIYSGLEFGQYFELNPDTKCHNVLLALTPATRMAFIFIQMYFIFLNNEQIKVYRYKIIARFGLMHMIGTNLAVWLNVLIQETKHEILTFYNPENRTLRISHRIPGHSRAHSILVSTESKVGSYAHMRVTRGLKGPYQIFECRRTNILGTLVQDASPFLFPCTIEYSLICAAILYVMWKGITRPQISTPARSDMISSPTKRSPHHYSVDCARAHRGLFVGILVLVLTIISLILFFVLISRPDFVALAVLEVTICELFIYITATIATLLGMIQIRHLQYDAFRSFSLDDILLVGAQTGSFLYNIFTVIAGHFSVRSDDWLVPINALASIVQTACQTMFILDAGRRQAVMPEHIRKKPGREIVTFMLVVNLAMWAISTLEKSRAESHPIQLNFYGLWAWTIITHVSMPLAIFYRFHSTVCLCEIWKRSYKPKPQFM